MSIASYQVILPSKTGSFMIKKFDERGFEAPFHFHQELELTFIIEGKGKRYVGTNMSGFQNNDLVLLGSNLPHCWKLENTKGQSMVIQFTHELFEGNFFAMPEMVHLKKLLKKSEGGLLFYGAIREFAKKNLDKLWNEKNQFRRSILLLEILNKLALTRNSMILNEKDLCVKRIDYGSDRINKVYNYIENNFQDTITLREASQIVNMTPNAFCKLFKKITDKTFIETTIDYRINHATKQLIETDKTIAVVCFESGFRDISHFYKMFTLRMGVSPFNYRKQFLKQIIESEIEIG
ncbi:MAG: AraC family transcriptional regulator [Ginsengibacter sp.]